MQNVKTAVLLFGAGVLVAEINHYFLLGATFEPPMSEMGTPLKITAGDASLTVGTSDYPGRYGFPNSAYLVMDKEDTPDDASLVLREAGNARAEIGLIGDNDIHFKTVTGDYGEEQFTDRLLIRETGEVDSFGTMLRQYGSFGTTLFVVGDTDGKTVGSGLEFAFDHDADVASITAIDRSVTTRPINMVGMEHRWHVGDKETADRPAMTLDSDGTLEIEGVAKPGSYTVATLPPAIAGGMIFVTDGAGGAPVLAFSDGEGWLRSDTRTAVSSE